MKIVFYLYKTGVFCLVRPRMSAPVTSISRLRTLIETAQLKYRYTLVEVSQESGVSYHRLWRFVRKTPPSDTISLDEADRIHKFLTGKPLLRQ